MSSLYAGRKRRRPVKSKPAVAKDPAKTNPSKRHRDRLNAELDRLASMLPFTDDVLSKLDKLSILRLSVSYLRNKNYFQASLHKPNSLSNRLTDGGTSHGSQQYHDTYFPEGEMLLQALNGFVVVVTCDGLVFYASHTIQNYLGFQQSDVIHQGVYELIHTEDRAEFRRQLSWNMQPLEETADPSQVSANNNSVVPYNGVMCPEGSMVLERSFVCRFRCLLDNSSGFLALHITGRIKQLHGQNKKLESGERYPQLALFAIACPLQPPSIVEIRTKNMIFRTKHRLDFSPLSLDQKGKTVLGYTEKELQARSGYQFVHFADTMYCADSHASLMRRGESGFVVFRLLVKGNVWKWVQANSRVVFRNGRPDYIISTHRPLSDDEGKDYHDKRPEPFRFPFTGVAILYGSQSKMPGMEDPQPRSKRAKSSKAALPPKFDVTYQAGGRSRNPPNVHPPPPPMDPRYPPNPPAPAMAHSFYEPPRNGHRSENGVYPQAVYTHTDTPYPDTVSRRDALPERYTSEFAKFANEEGNLFSTDGNKYWNDSQYSPAVDTHSRSMYQGGGYEHVHGNDYDSRYQGDVSLSYPSNLLTSALLTAESEAPLRYDEIIDVNSRETKIAKIDANGYGERPTNSVLFSGEMILHTTTDARIPPYSSSVTLSDLSAPNHNNHISPDPLHAAEWLSAGRGMNHVAHGHTACPGYTLGELPYMSGATQRLSHLPPNPQIDIPQPGMIATVKSERTDSPEELGQTNHVAGPLLSFSKVANTLLDS
ncbi:PREDICTED: aryl hydrocarbon receptor-like [Branchiostoma belcheri]|uniref:Aryl hydrocarbon receptor-like n=1 Tax=Branchiostoma belcheri TaxID=7741 RepID=A0A6P4YQX5_BRABE|nr:PREDICTED: aryl hydrocarbon receptor-like [Branchiostoma belcheri]XP_019619642.1 PREDICTED: aryl hydrocarbon receptor-like [Branchiostoma belcheri]